MVAGPVDQARAHDGRRREGGAHGPLAGRLGPVGRRGRVVRDAQGGEVQEPRRAPRRGEPGDAGGPLDVDGLEALAAFPPDADEVHDHLGVGHGRAHPVLAAEIGDDRLDAAGRGTTGPVQGDAHGPAVTGQARRQVPAHEARAAEKDDASPSHAHPADLSVLARRLGPFPTARKDC